VTLQDLANLGEVIGAVGVVISLIYFYALMSYVLSQFEVALTYHRDGLLADEGIETYTQSVAGLFDNPAVVEWWESEGKIRYSQELRQRISQVVYPQAAVR
jgi:hypothetical protein